MTLLVKDVRRIEKYTEVAQAPTLAPSSDHTDGSWVDRNIYKGELYIDLVSHRIYSSDGVNVFQLKGEGGGGIYSGSGSLTSNVIVDGSTNNSLTFNDIDSFDIIANDLSLNSNNVINLNSIGDINISTTAEVAINSSNGISLSSQDDIGLLTQNSIRLTSEETSLISSIEIDISSGGDTTISSGGDTTISSGGDTTISSGGDTILSAANVGVGATSPDTRFNILGSGSTSATYGLKVQNSTGSNDTLVVRDDGFVGIGTSSPLAKLHVIGDDLGVAFRVDGDNRTNLIYARENAAGTVGYVVIGGQNQLANAMLSVNGNIAIQGAASFGGTTTIGNTINTPIGWRLSLGGVSTFKDDITNNLSEIRTRNSNFVLRDHNNIHSYLSIKSEVAQTKIDVIARPSDVGTPNKTSVLNLISSYYDGTITQSKTASILHNIFSSPNSSSQIDFSIDGADIVSMLDNGNVGIGTATPNPSAILEISSTTKGVMLPRMTAAQGSAITGVDSLMIYVTNTDATFTSSGFWGYENGAWVKL